MIVVLFIYEGAHDKLDLSLGMSLSPGNASKQNGRLFHYPSNTYETQRGVSLTVISQHQSLKKS